MARLPDLLEFAALHSLKVGTIADLIHYRSQMESLVVREMERGLETIHGHFTIHAYRDVTSRDVHLAIVRGTIVAGEETLVRVHEPFSAVDLLDAASTAHSWNLNDALRTIALAERGVVVLLHRDESGDELIKRLQAKGGPPARKMDFRAYGIGAQILRDLGVTHMKLLAAPRKMPSMAGFDLEVTGYLAPSEAPPVVTSLSRWSRNQEG